MTQNTPKYRYKRKIGTDIYYVLIGIGLLVFTWFYDLSKITNFYRFDDFLVRYSTANIIRIFLQIICGFYLSLQCIKIIQFQELLCFDDRLEYHGVL